MFSSWLVDMERYIRDQSYGPAAIRVMEYNGVTFGIIDPYGYYVVNRDGDVYLLRDRNVAIRFFVAKDQVSTAVVHLNESVGFIDALFANPPPSASQLEKFILFPNSNPKRYTAIQLINKCLDKGILSLGE